MKKFDNYLDDIRLFPTPIQVGLLMDARNKLQAARTAVCEAQNAHYSATGKFLRASDVRTSEPQVRVEEAVAVSSGVIEVSIVRSWLSAGLDDGRGREVDEDKINRIYYPHVKEAPDAHYLQLGCIGDIRMETFPYDDIDPKELKAFLSYPLEDNDEWTIAFYGSEPITVSEETAVLAEPTVELPTSEEHSSEVSFVDALRFAEQAIKASELAQENAKLMISGLVPHVERLVNKIQAVENFQQAEAVVDEPPSQNGWPEKDVHVVYFVQGEESLRIKIGETHNLVKRIRSLRGGQTSEKLRILGWMGADQDTEKELHAKFRAHRVHNEWFLPAVEIFQFIVEHTHRIYEQ